MKISIITVVKNGMPHLKDAIRSFQYQKYQNKEHIIVFTKSSDDTKQYLKNIKFKNVKIIYDKNTNNLYSSINKGIKISKGRIIGLLHSDDIFFSNRTLNSVNKAFKHDVDFAYGNILFSHPFNLNKILRVWISGKMNKKKLDNGWLPPHTSIFIKDNIIKENLYKTKYTISSDLYFILNLIKKNRLKSYYINQFITVMRYGGKSTKISNFFNKLKEDLKITKLFFDNYFLYTIFKMLRKINQFYFLNIFRKKIVNMKSNYLKKFF